LERSSDPVSMEERKLCSKCSEPSEVRQYRKANLVICELNGRALTPAKGLRRTGSPS